MTTDNTRGITLTARMVVARHTLKNLISQIKEIEGDVQADVNAKLSQIKKIKEEITKVGMEIDSIKREIRLLNSYNVN